MTVEKPNQSSYSGPITTGTNIAMNQSQFLAITCDSLETQEKSCVQGAIGFGFASHWLKNWPESFKPITKHSNRNHVLTFNSHLKTALSLIILNRVTNWCRQSCDCLHQVVTPTSFISMQQIQKNFHTKMASQCNQHLHQRIIKCPFMHSVYFVDTRLQWCVRKKTF